MHQLSRSLDVLARSHELIEWYGDEFPLEMNPFMLSKSLVDKAEDMGLKLTVATVRVTYSLRAVVRSSLSCSWTNKCDVARRRLTDHARVRSGSATTAQE